MDNNIPRPDFYRSLQLNLNGTWHFEFDDGEAGEREKWYERDELKNRIQVPFCYQSKASGINSNDKHEVMWYMKKFVLNKEFDGKRILLNFGAVDYLAKVWINGVYTGCHRGGYTPFKFDITDMLNEGENRVTVMVIDRYDPGQPRGKQYWRQKPDRCFYTPTSGIWQSVWIEACDRMYIDRVLLRPDIDRNLVHGQIYLDEAFYKYTDIKIEARVTFSPHEQFHIGVNKLEDLDREPAFFTRTFNFDVINRKSSFCLNVENVDDIDGVHLWSMDRPNLYDLDLTLYIGDEVADCVKTYFGMRKISTDGKNILLNNRIIYQKLILDQGYWPDTLLTPPDGDAIKRDIEITKKLGFNGARKHQKIEDPRYYYWADKMGLLVWGEMPSSYIYNEENMGRVMDEWRDFILRDYNHPSIITWVPLNESWGVREIYDDGRQQDYGRALYYFTKSLDPTRLISTNDGWENLVADIASVHDYSAPREVFAPKYDDWEVLSSKGAVPRMLYCRGEKYGGQPIMITEFGGIAFTSEDEGNWGYGSSVDDEGAFLKRFGGLVEAVGEIPYVCGYCYTQLTDVMQEINGLMDYNRNLKIPAEKIKEILDKKR